MTERSEQLEAARALVTALEAENQEDIDYQLTVLTHIQESALYSKVGKLTRELHEALNNFNLDNHLVDLTQSDIPSTRERLDYVVKTTEEAAHKTIGYIDQTLPLASVLKETAEKIDSSWHRFRMREMTADEFREMSTEIESYLPAVKTHADQIHDNLSEMLLAQGYQDLTGQVISQVITLVEEVEENLIRLIKVSGQQMNTKQKETTPVDPLKAEGPQINKDAPNVVNNQDEVDDLLSSLGF